MNPETILLILRLTNIGLGILTEIEALIKRVQAGGEITDAEIEASGKRVDEAVARWKLATNANILADTATGAVADAMIDQSPPDEGVRQAKTE